MCERFQVQLIAKLFTVNYNTIIMLLSKQKTGRLLTNIEEVFYYNVTIKKSVVRFTHN